MELHFDYLTGADNQDIPIVASVISRAGLAHAQRGLKDIAFAVKIAPSPAMVGIAVSYGGAKNALGSKSQSKRKKKVVEDVSAGWTVGTTALVAVAGKEVDLREGDELRIELIKDLYMARNNQRR